MWLSRYSISRSARLIAGSIVLSLAAVTLPVGTATAITDQARAAAKRQGTPVEVAALRSETGTVFAQPNGG